MVNYEITKINKLLEVNNDMCHNYYYLIHGRIYNEGKTRMRKFRFVIWFDIFDVQKYFDDKEYISNDDIKEYRNEIAWSTAETYMNGIKDYNDEKGLKEFYEFTRNSIMDYNGIARG